MVFSEIDFFEADQTKDVDRLAKFLQDETFRALEGLINYAPYPPRAIPGPRSGNAGMKKVLLAAGKQKLESPNSSESEEKKSDIA